MRQFESSRQSVPRERGLLGDRGLFAIGHRHEQPVFVHAQPGAAGTLVQAAQHPGRPGWTLRRKARSIEKFLAVGRHQDGGLGKYLVVDR